MTEPLPGATIDEFIDWLQNPRQWVATERMLRIWASPDYLEKLDAIELRINQREATAPRSNVPKAPSSRRYP